MNCLKKKLLLRACKLQLQCSWTFWKIMLKKTYLGSQYLQYYLTYFLLWQHIMFIFLLVIYCGGTYLKSPPASYTRSWDVECTSLPTKPSPSNQASCQNSQNFSGTSQNIISKEASISTTSKYVELFLKEKPVMLIQYCKL